MLSYQPRQESGQEGEVGLSLAISLDLYPPSTLIENRTINITRIGTIMVTDNGSVTFNFNDGHNKENIWGSGRLFMFCEVAVVLSPCKMLCIMQLICTQLECHMTECQPIA